MSGEIVQALRETVKRLNSIKIGGGGFLGTAKIAKALKELRTSINLIQQILESKVL